MDADKLIERLAELEHKQWIEWSQALATNEALSEELLGHWRKLWIPYKNLSEEMKEEDREYARKAAAIFLQFLRESQEEAKRNLSPEAKALLKELGVL